MTYLYFSDPENALEMKYFMGRYTLEVIGSCAFGLDCASLKDPDAKFMKVKMIILKQ